jgi:hypothetical protein
MPLAPLRLCCLQVPFQHMVWVSVQSFGDQPTRAFRDDCIRLCPHQCAVEGVAEGQYSQPQSVPCTGLVQFLTP